MAFEKLKFYLQRIYRLSLSSQKQELLVWKDFVKLHQDAGWKSGIYEKDKTIEAYFTIGIDRMGTFDYLLHDGYLYYTVKVLEDFPTELTTDVFVLAAHINNHLSNGVVVIDVGERRVDYRKKRELLLPLLYTDDLYEQLIRHYKSSKDIYSAFNRLVEEQEAPAIIIADLLKNNSETKQ